MMLPTRPLTRLCDEPLSYAEIMRTADRIAHDIVETPLLAASRPDGRPFWLKAENLQPLGSFKIRAAAAAVESLAIAPGGQLVTASAGNFAQGLALAARRRRLRLKVHVPDTAAATKIAALVQLGAIVIPHPFADWWQIMETRETGDDAGTFVHPVCEASVIAGNATIGLEIARQSPDIDEIHVPFGGGGLVCGIAMAFRALNRPVRIIAVEVETSTPLTSARAAGGPVRVVRGASFVDGIGSQGVLAEMWPLLDRLVDEVRVVSIAKAKAAVRRAATLNKIVLEGAGAAAFASSAESEGRASCAILSGGNIDPAMLATILSEPDLV